MSQFFANPKSTNTEHTQSGNEVWAFSLQVYTIKLVSRVITQQYMGKKKHFLPQSLRWHTGRQMEGRWSHSRGAHFDLTSAQIPAQRKEQGTHRPCPYALLLCDVFKIRIPMRRMISVIEIQSWLLYIFVAKMPIEYDKLWQSTVKHAVFFSTNLDFASIKRKHQEQSCLNVKTCLHGI